MSGAEPARTVPNHSTEDRTSFFVHWRQGDRAALHQLAPILYTELLRLAKPRMNCECGGRKAQERGAVRIPLKTDMTCARECTPDSLQLNDARRRLAAA